MRDTTTTTTILGVLAACIVIAGLNLYGCRLAAVDATESRKTLLRASGDGASTAAPSDEAQTTQTTTNASGGARVTNLTIAAGGGWAVSLLVAGLLWRSRMAWKSESYWQTKAAQRLVASLEHGKRSRLTAENVCGYIKSFPHDPIETRINEAVKAVTYKPK